MNGIPDPASHPHELSRLHLKEAAILNAVICPCDCAQVRKLKSGNPIEKIINYVSVTSLRIYVLLATSRLGRGGEQSDIVTPSCVRISD